MLSYTYSESWSYAHAAAREPWASGWRCLGPIVSSSLIVAHYLHWPRGRQSFLWAALGSWVFTLHTSVRFCFPCAFPFKKILDERSFMKERFSLTPSIGWQEHEVAGHVASIVRNQKDLNFGAHLTSFYPSLDSSPWDPATLINLIQIMLRLVS